MTLEIGLLLFLTVAVVVLFSFEKISPDVTALTLVLALVFTKLLKPDVAFQGFGSETVIMILGLLILTAALMRTGVVDLVGAKILRFTGTSPMQLLLVVTLATLKILPFSVAVILGAVTAFFTKCITPDEAYREQEWKAVILIGSMLALGAAMEQTGTAKYLASLIVQWSTGHGPTWILAGFFALTVLLTQPMSNQAAAVVVIPVAIQTALQLGYSPRTFVMMVTVAASCSYLTPLEPSCLMVYGPGGYKFSDFLKYGSVLTLIIGAIALILVPRFWPLH